MAKFTRESLRGLWMPVPGLVMTVGALYVLLSNTFFWIVSESAEGTVIGAQRMEQIVSKRISNSYANAAMVSFVDNNNQEITFVADFGSEAKLYSNGEKVTVLYEASNPQNAKIQGFVSMYVGPFLLLFMGLVFSFIGMAFMPKTSKPKRRFIKNK